MPGRFFSLALRFFCWALALIPLACLIFLVVKYGVDVPYHDEWELVPLLEKSYQGTLSLRDLWVQHNEHRILFPKIIMLLLARASGWNISYELAMNVLFGIGIFAALICQIGRSKKSLEDYGTNWLIPVVSLVVFSLNQWRNWLLGWQMTIFMNIFAVAAGMLFLTSPVLTWRSFSAALLFGVVTTYSFANGIFYWLIGLPVLFFRSYEAARNKRIYLFGWLAAAAITIFSFLYDYHRHHHRPMFELILAQPMGLVRYVFSYLGNPIGTISYWGQPVSTERAFLAGFFGLVILIVTGVLLLRFRFATLQSLSPYFSFSLYALLSALMTAIGRLGVFDVSYALSPRYVTIANLLWVSDLVLLYLLIKATLPALRGRRGKRNAQALLPAAALITFALIVSLALRSYVESAPHFSEWHASFMPARAELKAGNIDPRVLGFLNTDLNLLKTRTEILKRLHLSVFRESNR